MIADRWSVALYGAALVDQRELLADCVDRDAEVEALRGELTRARAAAVEAGERAFALRREIKAARSALEHHAIKQELAKQEAAFESNRQASLASVGALVALSALGVEP
jgi:hypothetical protein